MIFTEPDQSNLSKMFCFNFNFIKILNYFNIYCSNIHSPATCQGQNKKHYFIEKMF